MPAHIAPHDSAWAGQFAREAASLGTVFGPVARRVAHIGSTAIPDILAKPVIDILIAVDDIAAVDGFGEAMSGLGYEAMGEYGIEGRRYFRKSAPDGTRLFHLHVFAEGSDAITRHLVFRDYLRAHPGHAREYSDLKAELALERKLTGQAYQDGKTVWIERTLADALAWAGGGKEV